MAESPTPVRPAHGPAVSAPPRTPSAELMAAVRAGDAEFVRRALAADPDALRERYPANDKTPNLTTLLHLAMPGDGVPRSPGQLEVARVILDAGLEVDTPAYGPNQGTC